MLKDRLPNSFNSSQRFGIIACLVIVTSLLVPWRYHVGVGHRTVIGLHEQYGLWLALLAVVAGIAVLRVTWRPLLIGLFSLVGFANSYVAVTAYDKIHGVTQTRMASWMEPGFGIYLFGFGTVLVFLTVLELILETDDPSLPSFGPSR